MLEYVCSGISEILVAIYVMILQETKENSFAEVSVLNQSTTIWMRWSANLVFTHTISVRVFLLRVFVRAQACQVVHRRFLQIRFMISS